MVDSELFQGRLVELIRGCACLRVTVKLRVARDKYYLDFDGSKTYSNPAMWSVQWTSWDKYVEFKLAESKFKPTSMVSKGESKTTVRLGSLFDILKAFS